MAARLISLTDSQSIVIDKPVIFIGRDSECDVVLNDSRRVSRKHCCLAHVNNHLLVRDLGSMNGVWINGQRIERTGTMKPGDELAIGDVRFRLSADDGSSPDQSEDPSAAVVDVSQDVPVIVSGPEDDVPVAEPAGETGSSELLVLPEIPRLKDDDGDIISLDDDNNYNDDDSKILPLSG